MCYSDKKGAAEKPEDDLDQWASQGALKTSSVSITCKPVRKSKLSGPTSDPQNQKLWGGTQPPEF